MSKTYRKDRDTLLKSGLSVTWDDLTQHTEPDVPAGTHCALYVDETLVWSGDVTGFLHPWAKDCVAHLFPHMLVDDVLGKYIRGGKQAPSDKKAHDRACRLSKKAWGEYGVYYDNGDFGQPVNDAYFDAHAYAAIAWCAYRHCSPLLSAMETHRHVCAAPVGMWFYDPTQYGGVLETRCWVMLLSFIDPSLATALKRGPQALRDALLSLSDQPQLRGALGVGWLRFCWLGDDEISAYSPLVDASFDEEWSHDLISPSSTSLALLIDQRDVWSGDVRDALSQWANQMALLLLQDWQDTTSLIHYLNGQEAHHPRALYELKTQLKTLTTHGRDYNVMESIRKVIHDPNDLESVRSLAWYTAETHQWHTIERICRVALLEHILPGCDESLLNDGVALHEALILL